MERNLYIYQGGIRCLEYVSTVERVLSMVTK